MRLYDGQSLEKLMQEAGFENVKARGYLETSIPHLEKVEAPGRVQNGAGVPVEGNKPST